MNLTASSAEARKSAVMSPHAVRLRGIDRHFPLRIFTDETAVFTNWIEHMGP